MIGAINPRHSRQPGPASYHLYGTRVRSSIPLTCPAGATPGLADVSLDNASSAYFASAVRQSSKERATKDWFHRIALPDGSDYLCWSGLFEFLISPDGRQIACHELSDVSRETFQTYLVSQALSCALLKQGIEPLHATVVIIHGQAVAFLGNCGYGKSSLGAAFLRAGHAILTDDMLVTSVSDRAQPTVIAHPGPPRIKLFPNIARRLLGRGRRGTRMNPGTAKLTIPLLDPEHCRQAVPLRALYVLRPPASSRVSRPVTIRPLTQRQACLDLIANTFNTIITDPARSARQFAWAAQLAGMVPVKSLSYPRSLACIPAVLAAICKDLGR
jgi:hypothetical protein